MNNVDTDNPNLNNATEDRREWWDAHRKEMDAKAEKLDAEQRKEYSKFMDDTSGEIDAMTDWTAASAKEIAAKTQKKWNEFEIKADKAV